MKMIKNVIGGALLTFLVSCSSQKEVAIVNSHSNQIDHPTYTTTYGPKGKIIKYDKSETENVQIANHVESRESDELSEPVKFKGTNNLSTKIGKTVGKISKNAGENYDFLMRQVEKKSIVYKALDDVAGDKDDSGDSSRNGFAIAGFVVSLVGLFIFGVILGAIAIVFGALSLKSQRRGLAIAALVIGIVDVVVALILIAGA